MIPLKDCSLVPGRERFLMALATWRVKAYLEYEIEAETKAEAVLRIGECIMTDMGENTDLREIAEVEAEKISDKPLED
jgi:hypothetical protein